MRITPCLSFLRKRSPDGATPNWGSRHRIAAYYLFIDLKGWKAELAWLDDLYRGQFTHISGHPSVTGRAQDRESSPAKDRRPTAVPCNQLPSELPLHTPAWWATMNRLKAMIPVVWSSWTDWSSLASYRPKSVSEPQLSLGKQTCSCEHATQVYR